MENLWAAIVLVLQTEGFELTFTENISQVQVVSWDMKWSLNQSPDHGNP